VHNPASPIIECRCLLSVMSPKPTVFQNPRGLTHEKRQSLAQEELGQDCTNDLVERTQVKRVYVNFWTVYLYPLPRLMRQLTTLSAPRGVTKIAAVNAIRTPPTDQQPSSTSLLSSRSNSDPFKTHQKQRNYKSLPRSSSSCLTTRSNSSNTHDLLRPDRLISW
jgi:hypothetical protein